MASRLFRPPEGRLISHLIYSRLLFYTLPPNLLTREPPPPGQVGVDRRDEFMRKINPFLKARAPQPRGGPFRSRGGPFHARELIFGHGWELPDCGREQCGRVYTLELVNSSPVHASVTSREKWRS